MMKTEHKKEIDKKEINFNRNPVQESDREMHKIERKVFSYIEKHRMITPGDNIVIGVSGGADSVCLLFLLVEYGKRVPVSLAAVHVNHCLRADAQEDALYVEALCRELKIPFYLTVADVRELAVREKLSDEDAGRRARYLAFDQTAEEMGGAKIAVAHNMGDNAETILFHLFRGSGLKGLCGIAPMRGNVIHPILCLERQEVEAYLRQHQIAWRTDSTNGEDHYRRNRIRHHILPYADSEIVQGAAGHMCRTAELLSETEDYLDQQTKAAWAQCVNIEGQSYTLDVSLFREHHIVLQKRILLGIAKALSPTGKDISAVHVKDLLSLFEEPGNRDLNLPFGILARRRYGSVVLERSSSGQAGRGNREETEKRQLSEKTRKTEDSAGRETQLPAETKDYPVTVALENGDSLEFRIIFGIKNQEVPRNQYTKWLDYDKIIESMAVRSRKQGDYLTVADRDGKLIHKILKDYMITEKIPREQRGKIPVLAMGSHVVWLVGYRISEYFKISENTNHILQVQLKKGPTASKTEEENVGTH